MSTPRHLKQFSKTPSNEKLQHTKYLLDVFVLQGTRTLSKEEDHFGKTRALFLFPLSLFLYAKGSSKLSSTSSSSSLSANGSTKFSGVFATTPEDARGAGVAPF